MADDFTSTTYQQQQSSLDERFTFIRQAGKGTYGTAWIAEDKTNGKKVAIKAINKSTTTRAEFKKELKYSKHLSKHPNIITTHDTAYETKTTYVMVQDYASGGDLFDAIEPEVGLPEPKARRFIYQIAKAVDSMHSKKLVHRDIKPENIVLGDKEGSFVQLIDFGMTLRTGTHVPKVCGSIPYTPPEICNASDDSGFFAEPSCDVWSVGVLLFCMLTGSFPWEQATLSDPNYYEFVQWQNGVIIKPPRMWQNFSPRLLTLFNKLLAMDPRDRCEVREVYKYLNDSWFIDTNIPLSDSFCEVSIYQHLINDFSDHDVETSHQCGLSADFYYPTTSTNLHLTPVTAY